LQTFIEHLAYSGHVPQRAHSHMSEKSWYMRKCDHKIGRVTSYVGLEHIKQKKIMYSKIILEIPIEAVRLETAYFFQ
jgi:hypothetical protein